MGLGKRLSSLALAGALSGGCTGLAAGKADLRDGSCGAEFVENGGSITSEGGVSQLADVRPDGQPDLNANSLELDFWYQYHGNIVAGDLEEMDCVFEDPDEEKVEELLLRCAVAYHLWLHGVTPVVCPVPEANIQTHHVAWDDCYSSRYEVKGIERDAMGIVSNVELEVRAEFGGDHPLDGAEVGETRVVRAFFFKDSEPGLVEFGNSCQSVVATPDGDDGSDVYMAYLPEDWDDVDYDDTEVEAEWDFDWEDYELED